MSAKNIVLVAGAQGVRGSVAVQHPSRIHDTASSKRADEAVRSAQADLARVARLTMMGELAASIAHEINQPLAAIVTDGFTGLHLLNDNKRNLEEARNAFSRIVSGATRAGNVIRSLTALVTKTGPEVAKFDINAAIEEVLALARSELMKRQVSLRTTLFLEQQLVLGDAYSCSRCC